MVPLGSSYFTVPGRATAPGAGAEAGPTVVWLSGEHVTWGRAPSRLPVPVRYTGAPRAGAESTEGLAQTA
jgi:hypothetical protein